jgi:hypothetical protein
MQGPPEKIVNMASVRFKGQRLPVQYLFNQITTILVCQVALKIKPKERYIAYMVPEKINPPKV